MLFLFLCHGQGNFGKRQGTTHLIAVIEAGVHVQFINNSCSLRKSSATQNDISVKRKPFLCDPARTRTWNPLIRSQMPYPLGHGAAVTRRQRPIPSRRHYLLAQYFELFFLRTDKNEMMSSNIANASICLFPWALDT